MSTTDTHGSSHVPNPPILEGFELLDPSSDDPFRATLRSSEEEGCLVESTEREITRGTRTRTSLYSLYIGLTDPEREILTVRGSHVRYRGRTDAGKTFTVLRDCRVPLATEGCTGGEWVVRSLTFSGGPKPGQKRSVAMDDGGEYKTKLLRLGVEMVVEWESAR